MTETSRRNFLRLTGASAIAAGALRPEFARAGTGARVSANDRIRIALIGAGGRGMSITRSALQVPGIELVAVADLYEGRRIRTQEIFGKDVQLTRDYRDLLARPDLDAVLIATPDHWHSAISIEAMNAGKDVYCEKPMVQTIEQGHEVIDTQKRTGRVCEVGSQRVSSSKLAKAKELLRSGDLGTLTLIEASINRNAAVGAWQYSIPPDASPQTVDWDRFLGPAPKRPFDPVRFFRWRNYWDYGTGIPGDLFVHLISGIHFLLDTAGPTQVQSTGGLRFWKDGRDVPDVVVGLYDYPATDSFPGFNMVLSVNFADGSMAGSPLRIIGQEGVMTIDDDISIRRQPGPEHPGYSIHTFPEALQKEFLTEYNRKYPSRENNVQVATEQVYRLSDAENETVAHFEVFFKAMRTRRSVVEDAVFGLRAAAPALLCNASYLERKVCGWDPLKMKRTS